MNTLRQWALAVVAEPDPNLKSDTVRGLCETMPIGSGEELAEPPDLPGRSARPELKPHTALKPRSMQTAEGRAALIHSLAHIELNAINLAADIVWRFAGLPDAFYRDWWQVAREEAYHFQLLRDHLRSLGYDYGDFPAHQSLWEMAHKTRGDLLARLAIVPRTLEARGLDASPLVKAKLLQVGDHAAGDILDIILRDEIGHVAVGNRWYRAECVRQGLEPYATYDDLATLYGAPRLKGPFNLAARRAAGFDERELARLGEQA